MGDEAGARRAGLAIRGMSDMAEPIGQQLARLPPLIAPDVPVPDGPHAVDTRPVQIAIPRVAFEASGTNTRPSLTMAKPIRYQLTEPASFLDHFRKADVDLSDVDFRDVEVAQAWALGGLAALARRNGRPPLDVRLRDNGASKFAHALGLEDVVEGRESKAHGEPGRTARLRRVARLDLVESDAREIGELMCPNEEDSQKTIRYVLVELMRNAIQHSQDPKGGVVAAQLMKAGYAKYPRPVLQVAVADAGVGLPEALRATYPIQDPEAAVVKALEPHVSGAFGPGSDSKRRRRA